MKKTKIKKNDLGEYIAEFEYKKKGGDKNTLVFKCKKKGMSPDEKTKKFLDEIFTDENDLNIFLHREFVQNKLSEQIEVLENTVDLTESIYLDSTQVGTIRQLPSDLSDPHLYFRESLLYKGIGQYFVEYKVLRSRVPSPWYTEEEFYAGLNLGFNDISSVFFKQNEIEQDID